jgi:L-aminopeptidase/D-esterase-like protein
MVAVDRAGGSGFGYSHGMQVSDIRGGAITDVAGIEVGHDTDPRRPTGCTVVIARGGAVGGVDVRGAAPGTRETELLSPENSVQRVHAVLLSGGSAFGLAAADGVVRWLEERDIGLRVGPVTVPIVPAAILFDLWLGDPKVRPDAAAGYRACQAASASPPAQGSVGAGTGATVGKLWGVDRAMRGGIGTASLTVGGITVGALVAVNAVGDVIDPGTGRPIAGARSADGRELLGTTAALLRGELPLQAFPGGATTIGCVATDAVLTKAQCRRLASAAHDGLARSIDPIHTALDGDTVFALATGRTNVPADPLLLTTMAATVTAAAVLRAVRAAATLAGPGLPSVPSVSDWEDREGDRR